MINRYLCLIGFLFISACIFEKNKGVHEVVALGSSSSDTVWVFLCGLTNYFNSPHEVRIRNKLNNMAKELGIVILAVCPYNRCPQFNNDLCWPHHSTVETLQTYKKLCASLKDKKIAGYIGFSNGGFFLNKLAQLIELNRPIISIGAPGYFVDSKIKNRLFLVIGKKDQYHYKDTLQFYSDSKKSLLDITLIEHEEGHIIPMKVLKNILVHTPCQINQINLICPHPTSILVVPLVAHQMNWDSNLISEFQ